ncbi:subtilase family protein [Wolffia australiana]
MERTFFFFFFFSVVVFLGNTPWLLQALELQTFIVHLHHGHGVLPPLQRHLSVLQTATSSAEEEAMGRLLYSYTDSASGFAARLSGEEAETLRRTPGVAAVHPDRRLELQTTYSHQFLGLGFAPDGAWARAQYGKGAIIGVLDTGVWPESPSFSDSAMGPVPGRWRGVCQPGQDFNSSACNRKLIGARFYERGHQASGDQPGPAHAPEYASARDAHGHGTHTSSTAAGAVVPGASVLGGAAGTAAGLAPAAHLAVYKVCWFNGCYSSDILAAIDDAIRDGVDVLSLSLGGFPIPLFEDNIAIGAFRAMASGLVVVCAAGNNGPSPGSVANEAPWILTVGASTTDRRFPAFVRTGAGRHLYGESLYPGNQFNAAELVDGEYCFRGSIPEERVKGKLVVCDRGVSGRAEKGAAVGAAGAAGMILVNKEINQEEDSVDVHVIPATLLGFSEGVELRKYMNSTGRPVARIEFAGTRVKRARAPAVALFSSRGPSLTDRAVLKPDVVAPGVNIIAAWPQNLGPSGLPEDPRRVNFSVLSGTSMACPHVSGLAALVRAAHPGWTPAAVKSAIMTTADVFDHYGKRIMDGARPAGAFAVGAGHVNPARAMDPGLVYDIEPEDYVAHLCKLGYTRPELIIVARRNVSCEEVMRGRRHFSLNYPSISVVFNRGEARRKVVQRRVTNVGPANSTYVVRVGSTDGVAVRVIPRTLRFEATGQVRSYKVWFESRVGAVKGKTTTVEGDLTWFSSHSPRHRVRSPVVVTWEG